MSALVPRVPSLRPEPARDANGLYVLPDPATGRPRSWMRATTLAHILSDEQKIHAWRERMVAYGLGVRADLVADAKRYGDEIRACGENWQKAKTPKALLQAVADEAADEVGASDGSTLGTDMHSLTEWHDAGRINEIEVPIDLLPGLARYVDTMDATEWHRPPQYIERIVVNTKTQTAGTFDRLLQYRGRGAYVIGDLKTQKTVSFGFLEPAIQFAQYAHADYLLNPETGALEPMPPVDREVGILIHAPSGGESVELYEVDLVRGWARAQTALDVLAAREESRGMGHTWQPPRTDPYAAILTAIADASTVDALTELWRTATAAGQWHAAHTAAAKQRKQQLAQSIAV